MRQMTFFIVFIVGSSLGLSAFAGDPVPEGSRHFEVTILDDWPPAPPLSEGTMKCPGGEIEWLNEITPYCPTTGQITFRDFSWWSCYQSEDPRLTGVGFASASGNWDVNMTGPVWGTWMIVPSNTCDPTALIAPTIFWEGTWQGKRSQYCEIGSCYWVGDLHLVGKGYGGSIDGIKFKGHELVTTFTPMPIAWDLIPGLPAPGPEGVITATLIE